MKKTTTLSSISGGFSTHGAISAAIASPLLMNIYFSCSSDQLQNEYLAAAFTAATIVFAADLLKASDRKLISLAGQIKGMFSRTSSAQSSSTVV